jgi:hypothetical protein
MSESNDPHNTLPSISSNIEIPRPFPDYTTLNAHTLHTLDKAMVLIHGGLLSLILAVAFMTFFGIEPAERIKVSSPFLFFLPGS